MAGETILGGYEHEQGFQLAEARRLHVFNRYALGAPTVTVNVRRSGLATVRAGDWVVLNLSWFPDYVTARRGLLALAQITALADLDCAWRRVTAEIVTPLEAES